MTCQERRRTAPLFLTGELSAEEHRQYTLHLARCPICEAEFDRHLHLDARLRTDVGLALPDDSHVRRNVMARIEKTQARRLWIGCSAAAAGVLLAVTWTYNLHRLIGMPRVYVDAARDHVAEVVEGQARKWRSSDAEIEALTSKDGISLAQAKALSTTGYKLERAKFCRLGGERMLHLVYARGASRYSVFVRPDGSEPSRVTVQLNGPEQVAGLETGKFKVVLVSEGSDCAELARFAAARL